MFNIVREVSYYARDHLGQRWRATTTEESYATYSVTRAKRKLWNKKKMLV